MSNPSAWTVPLKSPIGDLPSIFASVSAASSHPSNYVFATNAPAHQDEILMTKVPSLAVTHNGSYTLRGIKRTRSPHPHASPYVANSQCSRNGDCLLRDNTHTHTTGGDRVRCLCFVAVTLGATVLYDSLVLNEVSPSLIKLHASRPVL